LCQPQLEQLLVHKPYLIIKKPALAGFFFAKDKLLHAKEAIRLLMQDKNTA
jgi:hypothetical protein